jgi:hypothetical protein
MADNAKKVSELPTASNVASTDRVLVLRNPASNASVRTVDVSTLFSNGSILSISNVAINNSDTANTSNYKTQATTLLLTKQSQSLGTNNLNQDHHYYLPNGSEGQVMYFTAKTGLYIDRIFVWAENLRNFTGAVINNRYWIPFGNGWERSLAIAVYVDGAWNIDSTGTGP